tara:strand:- start:1884 stop:2453 length:570 start_codon:yes stop_codon:yes gene_type:complete
MVPIPLETYFNTIAVTGMDRLAEGRLNIWRNSYPLEEARALGREIAAGGMRFRLAPFDGVVADNVRCMGQLVALPPARYDWIYMLCSAERRVEDEAALHFVDGAVDFVPFCIADFWPGARARNGEQEAIRFSAINFPRHRQERIEPGIWRQRLPVSREVALTALRLPRNIAGHVFALTCLLAEDHADGD